MSELGKASGQEIFGERKGQTKSNISIAREMLDFENVIYIHNGLITLSYPLRENLRQMDRLIAPGENLSGLCYTTQAIVLKC